MGTQIAQLVVNGVIVGGIYALAASGLTVITGVLNLINFAHGEFYMLGAYFALTAATALGFGFVPYLLVSMAGVALVGVLSERFVFRPLRFAPAVSPLIASLGLSIALQAASLVIWQARPLRLPGILEGVVFSVGGVSVSAQRILVCAVAAVLILILQYFIKRTWLGIGIRAMSKDLTTAGLVGVDIDRVAPMCFALAGALAGAAGALVGPLFVLQPTMGALMGLKVFVLVIIGGAGNVTGAIYAGILLGVTENLVDGLFASRYKDIIAFVVLLVVLSFKRESLAGRD